MRRVLLICGFVLVLVPTLVGFARPDRSAPQPAAAPASSVAHPVADERFLEPRLLMPRVVVQKLLPFDWPAKGSITGVYGNDGGRRHPGVDIGILRSLTVKAAAPGKVLHAGYTPGFEGYGKVVVVKTGKYTVLYAHLSRVGVHKGERLKRDQWVGRAGCTGWCTGTHLHFEVRNKRGRTLNPLRLLAHANAS